MSTTLSPETNPAPAGQDAARRRTTTRRRVWLAVLVLAIVGVVTGALVILGWMVDETHFDRPSADFDELEAQLESLPGVSGVDKERWVEAPTFSNPTSWVSVAVDQAGVPGLLEAACSSDYPDAVTWSIRVRTPGAAEVSLHAAPTAADTDADDARCLDFGFDAVRLIDELDRVAPGLAVQPTIWNDDVLSLVALEEEKPAGFTHLLPLVEHADDLLVAAGLDADGAVEINSANLGVVFESRDGGRYLALLTDLAESRAVSFWADGGGTPIDGIDKVQIVAPVEQRAAIEETIRSSGLEIADLPVRFLEQ
ncbi:hypothetical protein [Microbacterium sulfonylureivorans]|uniref:hypothetical protein n=1 Tax=Microbacterium sulfonylureivorans TaxID=2486854 RepID=UPI000FD7A609|nr:hypothetical protein [Microbacterium sulfonylureivorans]